jgi:hypothetical protein
VLCCLNWIAAGLYCTYMFRDLSNCSHFDEDTLEELAHPFVWVLVFLLQDLAIVPIFDICMRRYVLSEMKRIYHR